MLLQEVLKRDVIEGDKADEARKKVAKANSRAQRKKESEEPAAPLETP